MGSSTYAWTRLVAAMLFLAGCRLGLIEPKLAAPAAPATGLLVAASLLSASILSAAGTPCRRRSFGYVSGPALLACLSLGLMRGGWADGTSARDPLAGWDGRMVAVRGVVAVPVSSSAGRERYGVALDWAAVRGGHWTSLPCPERPRVLVTVPLPTPRNAPRSSEKPHASPRPWPTLARWGQNVSVVGRLQPPAGPRVEGDFDYRAWLADQGIHHVLQVRDPQALAVVQGAPLPPWWALAARARGAAEDVFDATLPYPHGALLRGIVLGNGNVLPDPVAQNLRATGTYHVVAAAGLNVGILLVIVAAIADAVRVGRAGRLMLSLAVTAGYALVVGATVSIVRASLMGGLAQLSRALDRETECLAALAAAVTGMALWNPHVVNEAGFQMSVACVLGIALLSPHLEQRLLWLPRPVRGVVALTAGIQLAVMPLIMACFHTLSLTAVLGNLLVVPLCQAGLATGIVLAVVASLQAALAGSHGLGALLAYALGATLVAPLAGLAWGLMEGAMRLLSVTAAMPGSGLQVAAPGLVACTLYYAALGGLFILPRRVKSCASTAVGL